MGSTSLLGGPRGSLGRAGHSSIQSFLGQQSACTLLVDRENERTTSWSHVGAVDSSETLSCSFSGPQSPCSRVGSRAGLQNDSASVGGGSPRCSGSRLFSCSGSSRASSFGMSSGESCSGSFQPSSGILYPTAPILCRSLESTTARVLGLPGLAGRFAPSLKVHRSLGSVPRKGGNKGYDDSSSGGQRRSTRAMAVSPDDGKKILSRPEFREAAEMQMMKEWSNKQFFRTPGSELDTSLNMFIRVLYAFGKLILPPLLSAWYKSVEGCWD